MKNENLGIEINVIDTNNNWYGAGNRHLKKYIDHNKTGTDRIRLFTIGREEQLTRLLDNKQVAFREFGLYPTWELGKWAPRRQEKASTTITWNEFLLNNDRLFTPITKKVYWENEHKESFLVGIILINPVTQRVIQVLSDNSEAHQRKEWNLANFAQGYEASILSSCHHENNSFKIADLTHGKVWVTLKTDRESFKLVASVSCPDWGVEFVECQMLPASMPCRKPTILEEFPLWVEQIAYKFWEPFLNSLHDNKVFYTKAITTETVKKIGDLTIFKEEIQTLATDSCFPL